MDELLHFEMALGGGLYHTHGAPDAIDNGGVVEEGTLLVLVGQLVTEGSVGEGGDIELAAGHGGLAVFLAQAAHLVAGRGLDHAHQGLHGVSHKDGGDAL